LGVRSVRENLIEAATPVGAAPWQVHVEVQFPLAMRTAMAGLNQNQMLALTMVVIPALTGAGVHGRTVCASVGQLEAGNDTAGGVGIVLLAIILDRISQGLGEKRAGRAPSLLQTMRNLFSLRGSRPAGEARRRADHPA